MESLWLEANSRSIAQQFKAARGDPSVLVRSLKATIAQAPNPLPLILLVGDILISRGHLAAAETVFKHALELDAENLMALNGLGKALYKQNRHEEAAAALRVATRESQANIGRLCLLGEMELAQINPDAARKHFDRALAIDAGPARQSAQIPPPRRG